MQIFVLQMKVVMLTDGETGHQQIVITDGRIVSGPRVRILTFRQCCGYEFSESESGSRDPIESGSTTLLSAYNDP
jgi:hypothetical protein